MKLTPGCFEWAQIILHSRPGTLYVLESFSKEWCRAQNGITPINFNFYQIEVVNASYPTS